MEEQRQSRSSSQNSITSNSSEKNSRTAEIELKIAIIGLTNTGKSSILHTYIYQKFPKDIEPTIEDKYSTPIKIEGMYCKLNIMDTSGDKTYDYMFESWVHANDGFILTYAFDNKESFNEVKIKYEQIKKNKIKYENQDYSIIIVGNKGDLKDEEKVVAREEVDKFCKSKGLDNLECSALKNINIKEVIYAISQRMLQKKYPEVFGIDDEEIKHCYCF